MKTKANDGYGSYINNIASNYFPKLHMCACVYVDFDNDVTVSILLLIL